MDWKSFWDELARSKDPHRQVARISKAALPMDIVQKIAQYIIEQLGIQPEDHVLDVCCGNGMLTAELAQYSRHVTGVDLSPEQIQNARLLTQENTTFYEGDGRHLSEVINGQYNKVLCYFSFQYFDTYPKGREAVKAMKTVLKPGGAILLGDVPDHAKKGQFFNTWQDLFKNKVNRFLDRDAMGKFWKTQELDTIAGESGLSGKHLEQPEGMLYSHYRFDYLMQG